jgi:predicted XRE-type DNA-binding protein
MSKKSHEIGSGNVFKDLGIPNAEEHLVKAQLVFKIDTIMKDRGLKQAEAADLLAVKQPDVSKMLRGDFRQFSVERLLRFLVALDHDVEIIVRPHRGKNAARPCISPENGAHADLGWLFSLARRASN